MNEKIKTSVQLWLKWGFFLIGIMLLLGGGARLTGSGLSMVTWDLFWGVFPPMSQNAWESFFEAYKKSPEYLKINFSMDLEGFKSIFWLEYLHRLMGRILGLYFLIPLFLGLNRQKTLQLMVGFFLITLQGLLGWLMVQSGLKNIPHVNPFFLSGHLMLASFLLLWMIWEYQERPKISGYHMVYVGVLLIEIFWGGLVAGFKAGYIYNSFPLMEGQWFPCEVSNWVDLFMTPEGVQWLHRAWSIIVLCCIIHLAVLKRNKAIFICLTAQIVLGISALLFKVPLVLGLLHQLNAFVLLGLTSFVIFLKKNERNA